MADVATVKEMDLGVIFKSLLIIFVYQGSCAFVLILKTARLIEITLRPFMVRVPLIKGKTARQRLQEKGLWEEYRKKHAYNPLVKFQQTGTEPMTNDADVS